MITENFEVVPNSLDSEFSPYAKFNEIKSYGIPNYTEMSTPIKKVYIGLVHF